MFWNISRTYFFFFSIQNIKSNYYIIFSNFTFFSQSSSPDGIFIPSQLYLFMKDLIFVILCGSFLISTWFNVMVTAYWKHLLSFLLRRFIAAFLLFCFLSNQENLYMIHRDLDWFYHIYDTINEHNWMQTHLSSILNYFGIYF